MKKMMKFPMITATALVLTMSTSSAVFAGNPHNEGGGGGDQDKRHHYVEVNGGGVGDVSNRLVNKMGDVTVRNRNDVDIDNRNNNTVVGVNKSKNINDNRSSATAGVENAVSNTGLNLQGQDQKQKQGQKQAQGQGQGQNQEQGDVTNDISYISNEEHRRNPVNSAYAAPLTSSDDTCMGSTTMGGQGMSLGLSFGTTWRDADCVRRKDARILQNMGLTDVAKARLCQSEDNAEAFAAAGKPCTDARETASSNGGTVDSGAVVGSVDITSGVSLAQNDSVVPDWCSDPLMAEGSWQCDQ
ncbi:hypothetical protein ACFLY0_00195 [Patescibacteria group bacterium]